MPPLHPPTSILGLFALLDRYASLFSTDQIPPLLAREEGNRIYLEQGIDVLRKLVSEKEKALDQLQVHSAIQMKVPPQENR